MLTVALTFIVILLCGLGLAIGTLWGGKPLGTCCGKAGEAGSGSGRCSLCRANSKA